MTGKSMRKGEMTRQKIVVQAAPVFNQRGFAGCSMQDVMHATGMEKGGIYRHFASKEDLALEAFKYTVEQAWMARMGDLKHIRGAIPRLTHVVRAFVEVPSPIPGGCPLMNVAADVDMGSAVIAKQARTAIRTWKKQLCAILKEGMENNEVRKNIEPVRIANVLISTLEGALMISRLEGSRHALLDAQASLNVLISSLTAANPKQGKPSQSAFRASRTA